MAFLDAPSMLYTIHAKDQLSSIRASVARNNLRTLFKALDRADGRIDLPDELVAERLAGALLWVGRTRPKSDRAGARPYYREALRHLSESDRRLGATIFREWVLSFAPFHLGQGLVRGARAVRRLRDPCR